MNDRRFLIELGACLAGIGVLFAIVVTYAESHHWQWGGGSGCCVVFTPVYGYGSGIYHGYGGDDPESPVVSDPVEEPVDSGD